MLKSVLFFLLLASPFSHAADTIIAECRLLNEMKVLLMTFPGKQCSFLDDGTVISLGSSELRRFGSNGEVMWAVNLISMESTFFLSHDSKSVLIMSVMNGKLPYDPRVYYLRVYDLDGFMVSENNSFDLFGSEKSVRITDFGQTIEGDYFINVFHDSMYILNKNLTKIVKSFKFPGTDNHLVKDVKVTEKGSYVYLHLPKRKLNQDLASVSVEEFLPGKIKAEKIYPPGSGASFYFPHGGSLTLSKNAYVINHPLSGTYVVSRKTGLVENFFVESHVTDTFRPPRSVSLQNLETFFSRWTF
ncbi:MAG: hypothetical protein V4598_11875 [Bdellovibrionota bacterium]